MTGFKEGAAGFSEAKDQLDQGLEEVVHQLDEIELLLAGHENRIAALEDQLRTVRTKLSGK